MNTPNATVTLDSSVTVSGTTTVQDVSNNTFNNNGSLKNVIISDANGGSFNNQGTIAGNITIKPVGVVSAPVNLRGNIDSPVSVEGNNPQLTIATDAVLSQTVTVNTNNAVLIANNNADIKVSDSFTGATVEVATGKAVTVTAPATGINTITGSGTVTPTVNSQFDQAKIDKAKELGEKLRIFNEKYKYIDDSIWSLALGSIAYNFKANVRVSVDGSDVEPGYQWVTPEERASFDTAVQEAKDIQIESLDYHYSIYMGENHETIEQVEAYMISLIDRLDSKVNLALQIAQEAPRRESPNYHEPDPQLSNVREIGLQASSSVFIADSSADVPNGVNWVTQEIQTVFYDVLFATMDAYNRTDLTQEQIQTIVQNQEAATATYKAAMQVGTKEGPLEVVEYRIGDPAPFVNVPTRSIGNYRIKYDGQYLEEGKTADYYIDREAIEHTSFGFIINTEFLDDKLIAPGESLDLEIIFNEHDPSNSFTLVVQVDAI